MKQIRVTTPLMPALDDYICKLQTIWENSWLTNNGPMVQELQRALTERTGCAVELFVNGHMALDIAIKALGLHGEVITTPFTFASTIHALVLNGCTPVFCDIKPTDYTIDENKIEALITEKTTAIVPVHVYGCPCNVKQIEEIAAKHHLKVLYDAAHAFDVTLNGTNIASFGDRSMFSFHATKVFNTIEGGALTFRENGTLAERLQRLRNFGIANEESVDFIGLNAKMNEMAGAMGLCNLPLMEQALACRKQITEWYMEVLQEQDGIRTLDYEKMNHQGITYNYAYMPIEVDGQAAGYSRDELCEVLHASGIGARKYFYPLVPDYDCYRGRFRFADAEIPVARRVSERILTLPLSASMCEEDVERVCEVMRNMRR